MEDKCLRILVLFSDTTSQPYTYVLNQCPLSDERSMSAIHYGHYDIHIREKPPHSALEQWPKRGDFMR